MVGGQNDGPFLRDIFFFPGKYQPTEIQPENGIYRNFGQRVTEIVSVNHMGSIEYFYLSIIEPTGRWIRCRLLMGRKGGDEPFSPVESEHQSGNYMPDAPPRRDKCHTAQLQFGREYPRVEN